MKPILLSPTDLLIASSLIVVDAVLSVALHLQLERRLAIATFRMVVQLVLIGYVLRLVFAVANPAFTLLVLLVMGAIAAREVAARPTLRFVRGGNLVIGGTAVGSATALTAILALTTAIRPTPWFDPRYAIPLTGIILGNVLNGASIALDGVLGGVTAQRPGIEARLALGATFRVATRALRADSLRRAMLPAINQMSAAGVITLPGIMTGQIIAGMDPLEAAKYQILLMFLLSGASALAAVVTVEFAARRLTDGRERLRLDCLQGRGRR